METLNGGSPIYVFDRESGNLIRRIHDDLPNVTHFLTFSPDGRYLAASLGGSNGLRVFDRDKDWREAFHDNRYGDESYGAAFATDGRLATTSYDGLIRLYRYDPNNSSPTFRRVGEPVEAPSGNKPYRVAFSPHGQRLAVGYDDVVAVDVLDGATLSRLGGGRPAHVKAEGGGLSVVAWSAANGETLFAAGGVADIGGRPLLFAWDRGGLGDQRRMTYCAADTAAGVDVLPDGRIVVASMEPCLGLIDARGEPVWTVGSPVLKNAEQRYQRTHNKLGFDRTRFPRSEGERRAVPNIPRVGSGARAAPSSPRPREYDADRLSGTRLVFVR